METCSEILLFLTSDTRQCRYQQLKYLIRRNAQQYVSATAWLSWIPGQARNDESRCS